MTPEEQAEVAAMIVDYSNMIEAKNEQIAELERVLREVLTYVARSGWTRGRPEEHGVVKRYDYVEGEDRDECRCGSTLPCPLTSAWEAIAEVSSSPSN